MRFAAGIGIFTTVGLLVCGSVSAAQATDEETPQPPSTESALPSASASTDTEDGPSEENSEDPPDTEAMPMNCEQTERDVETVTVQFQEDIPFDEVTVKITVSPRKLWMSASPRWYLTAPRRSEPSASIYGTVRNSVESAR